MADDPSGKFVLRLPPELHARLRREATRRNVSLNQICRELIGTGLSGEAQPALGRPGLSPGLQETLKASLGNSLLGVVLFGSTARGDATEASDIDLLIVLEPGSRVHRGLYLRWDEWLSRSGIAWKEKYAPQFVALPEHSSAAGSIWFETALDGAVLWEADGRVSATLRAIRHEIAEGKLVRRVSHGHPYWERKSGAA